jgi:formylglycine-generating enzyme required for sulfatase activity
MTNASVFQPLSTRPQIQANQHGGYGGLWGAMGDGSAWLDPEAQADASRLLRGGSWFIIPRNCRSAYRHYFDPGYVNDDVGFRVVCLPQGSSS